MSSNNIQKTIVWPCPGCVAIRNFQWEKDDIYSCPVCGLRIEYKNGSITVIRSSITFKGAG